jgi:hypothetical protein
MKLTEDYYDLETIDKAVLEDVIREAKTLYKLMFRN